MIYTGRPLKCRGFRVNVTPEKFDIGCCDNFYYSVSIGVPNQNKDDLVDAFLWASKRYPLNNILLGDGLYKITLRITEGLCEEEANYRSIMAGDIMLSYLLNELRIDVSKVQRTTTLLLDDEFMHNFDRIEKLYLINPSFKESVHIDAESYVNRQVGRGAIKIDKAEALKLSILYLKQEIAVYLLLAERGCLGDIYLGQEIPTLAKIMNGKIPQAPEALKRRVNIGLKKKGNRQVDHQLRPHHNKVVGALPITMPVLVDVSSVPDEALQAA